MSMINLIITLMLMLSFAAFAKNETRYINDRYICHKAKGMAQTSDLAMFMARNEAISLIRLECGGYSSKEIFVEKQNFRKYKETFRGYADVCIPYSTCDSGKSPLAKTLTDIENPLIVKEQELYQKYKELPPKTKNDDEKKILSEIVLLIQGTKNELLKKIDHIEKKIEKNPIKERPNTASSPQIKTPLSEEPNTFVQEQPSTMSIAPIYGYYLPPGKSRQHYKIPKSYRTKSLSANIKYSLPKIKKSYSPKIKYPKLSKAKKYKN